MRLLFHERGRGTVVGTPQESPITSVLTKPSILCTTFNSPPCSVLIRCTTLFEQHCPTLPPLRSYFAQAGALTHGLPAREFLEPVPIVLSQTRHPHQLFGGLLKEISLLVAETEPRMHGDRPLRVVSGSRIIVKRQPLPLSLRLS